jgi:hypothetical protein
MGWTEGRRGFPGHSPSKPLFDGRGGAFFEYLTAAIYPPVGLQLVRRRSTRITPARLARLGHAARPPRTRHHQPGSPSRATAPRARVPTAITRRPKPRPHPLVLHDCRQLVPIGSPAKLTGSALAPPLAHRSPCIPCSHPFFARSTTSGERAKKLGGAQRGEVWHWFRLGCIGDFFFAKKALPRRREAVHRGASC